MVLPHQGFFSWLDRSSAQSCHDEVGLIDVPHHLLSLGTEFYEHHGRDSVVCDLISGNLECSLRFLSLYKVAPSRRLSTQKADATEATNALGEIVFVNPNEHRQAFLEQCPWRENEGWNPTFSLIQMCIGNISWAMPWRESEFNTKDEIYGPNETVQLAEQFGGWRLPTTNKKMPSRKIKIERSL